MKGFKSTTLATLLSRILGMVRDVVMAAIFGMSGSRVMDAFVMAFRGPDLFRRLFAEGILSVSYLPDFTRLWQEDRPGAWRLFSGVFYFLLGGLLIVTIGIEVILGGILYWANLSESTRLTLELSVIFFPYILFVCLLGQLSATLHGLLHFRLPALAPVVLNTIWLLTLGVGVWSFTDAKAQVYTLAFGILLAGGVNLIWHWKLLRKKGLFLSSPRDQRERTWGVFRRFFPMAIGLSAIQLNTLFDGIMAWAFTKSAASIPGSLESAGYNGGRWLEFFSWDGTLALSQGAATATYYGERLYMLPVGLLGVVVATISYPLLVKLAQQKGGKERLGEVLVQRMQLLFFLALPASVGLAMLSYETVALLFQRGAFSEADTIRTAAVVASYGVGIWAFSLLPLLVRSYFALGSYTIPLWVTIGVLGAGIVTNLPLLYFFQEWGMALGTSCLAIVQTFLLMWWYPREGNQATSLWSPLRASVIRSTIASVFMGLAVWGTGILGRFLFDRGEGTSWGNPLLERGALVAVPVIVAIGVYFLAHKILKGPELGLLFQMKKNDLAQTEY
ncbi:MAG: murein biosynthesis integral membrane protein MurJ [Pirellulaceae bacterium]|nr:murein biosynthesis integral membrane protein MurJ [Pirellulaceae bacterium]